MVGIVYSPPPSASNVTKSTFCSGTGNSRLKGRPRITFNFGPSVYLIVLEHRGGGGGV